MRRKLVSIFICMLLVFSLTSCGSKVVSEEQIKSYVQSIVGEESKVSVTEISKNNFEIHLTQNVEGVVFITSFMDDASRNKVISLCKSMGKEIESSIPTWFQDVHNATVSCTVFVDLTDTTFSKVAETEEDTVYYSVDTSGNLLDSKGNIVDLQ